MLRAIQGMEIIQRMAALKLIYVVFLIILRFGFGSCRILTDEKDQGTFEPNNPGFQAGLGGTWEGIPFLGIGPGAGFLGIGNGQDFGNYARDGKGGFVHVNGGSWIPFFTIPGFTTGSGNGATGEGSFGGGGGGGGSGWFEGGNSGPSGCSCDSTRSGGGGCGSISSGGRYPTPSNPSGSPATCRPMNCPNDSVSYCEGYRIYFDSSAPYWCQVPGIGTLPFWCKGGQPLNCKPINCAYGGACGGDGGYLGYVTSFWTNSHASQKNQDDWPSEVAAGHN